MALVATLASVYSNLRKALAAVGFVVKSTSSQLVTAARVIIASESDPSAAEAAGSVCLTDDGPWVYQNSSWTPPVQEASGTIATGAVATLNATPVTVIAAPGAGKYIEVISCHWMLDFESAAYDGAAAGEDLALKYTNASGDQVAGLVDHDGFGNASADAHAIVKGVAVTPVANAAVVAHILTGEWYAAAGDSPVKYNIRYIVRDLAL